MLLVENLELVLRQMSLKPSMLWGEIDNIWHSSGHLNAVSLGHVLDDDTFEAVNISGFILLAGVVEHDDGARNAYVRTRLELHAWY